MRGHVPYLSFGRPAAEKLGREDAAVFPALVLDGTLRRDDPPLVIFCGRLEDLRFQVNRVPDLHSTGEADLVDPVKGDERLR